MTMKIQAVSQGGADASYDLAEVLPILARSGSVLKVSTGPASSRAVEVMDQRGATMVLNWGHHWGCAPASGFLVCKDEGTQLRITDARFFVNDSAESWFGWDASGRPIFVVRKLIGSCRATDLPEGVPTWVAPFAEHAYAMGRNPLPMLRQLFPTVTWSANGAYHHWPLKGGELVVDFSTTGYGISGFTVPEGGLQ
jgi:hypothetical protein